MIIEVEEITNGVLLRISNEIAKDKAIFVPTHKDCIRKIATLLGGSSFAEQITFGEKGL